MGADTASLTALLSKKEGDMTTREPTNVKRNPHRSGRKKDSARPAETPGMDSIMREKHTIRPEKPVRDRGKPEIIR